MAAIRITRFLNRNRRLSVFSLLITAFATGCGGGGANAINLEVRTPASKRPDIDLAKSPDIIKIPGQAEFNFQSFRKQAWGPEGTGHCFAKPVGKNGAICHASASDTTGAWSEFQFGYCFDNTSTSPLDGVVKLHLKMRESVANETSEKAPAAEAPDDDLETPQPVATGALSFFIKDTNGRLIRREDLLATTLSKGPSSNSQARELVFDARLEPNTGYYFVLAARADVTAIKNGRSSIEVEVSDVSLELNCKPADSKSALAPTAAPDESVAASP